MSWLTGRVGDRTVEFLLDTGANNSVLHDKTAAALGLKVTPRPGTMSGVLIPLQQAKSADLAGLVVGKYLMGTAAFDVFDLAPVLKKGGWDETKHYGIFGSNLLTYFHAVIDYRRRVLYLRDDDRYESLLWEGEWALAGLVDHGKVYTDPKFLARFKLVVADRAFTLTQDNTLTQTGRLGFDWKRTPKLYGLTEVRKNGTLLFPDRQPPKPGEYEILGAYEADERTLKFSVPRASLVGAAMIPKNMESTAENKLAVFTWKRVK